jgi:hypothetical protein
VSEESFPLAAMHHGQRFKLATEKDAMRLLLIAVRDGAVSVDQALSCFTFDRPTVQQLDAREKP